MSIGSGGEMNKWEGRVFFQFCMDNYEKLDCTRDIGCKGHTLSLAGWRHVDHLRGKGGSVNISEDSVGDERDCVHTRLLL